MFICDHRIRAYPSATAKRRVRNIENEKSVLILVLGRDTSRLSSCSRVCLGGVDAKDCAGRVGVGEVELLGARAVDVTCSD